MNLVIDKCVAAVKVSNFSVRLTERGCTECCCHQEVQKAEVFIVAQVVKKFAAFVESGDYYTKPLFYALVTFLQMWA